MRCAAQAQHLAYQPFGRHHAHTHDAAHCQHQSIGTRAVRRFVGTIAGCIQANAEPLQHPLPVTEVRGQHQHRTPRRELSLRRIQVGKLHALAYLLRCGTAHPRQLDQHLSELPVLTVEETFARALIELRQRAAQVVARDADAKAHHKAQHKGQYRRQAVHQRQRHTPKGTQQRARSCRRVAGAGRGTGCHTGLGAHRRRSLGHCAALACAPRKRAR